MSSIKELRKENKEISEEVRKQARDSIVACRWLLTRIYPYFSNAWWSLQVIESTACPTMGVDAGWRLYYNPEFTLKLSRSEILATLVHELFHMIRNHHKRCGDRDPEQWNWAADLEINDDVQYDREISIGGNSQKISIKLFDNALFAETYGYDPGLLAEEYYNMIEGDPNVKKKVESCKERVGGSIADGQSREWEDGKDIDSQDFPALSDIEKEIIKRQCAEDAQKRQKEAGDVPAGVQRWAETVVSSKTDWRKLLTNKVKKALANLYGTYDYSYSTLSRRRLPKIILPGMVSPEVHLTVVVDTSGSVSDKDLAVINGEIDKLIRTCDISQIRVVSCDATIHTDVYARNLSDLKYNIKGGGGTDMGIALSYLSKPRKGKPVPSLVIVLTDGYTPWHEHKPPFNVIVALVGDYTYDEAPSYASLIKIDPATIDDSSEKLF